MSWEILSKENAISLAQLWQENGKSDTVIREHLVTKGLTYPEADEVLAEINQSPFKANTVSNYGSLGRTNPQNTSDVKQSTDTTASLGELASEQAKPQDSPRAIIFQLWKEGKSKLYIRNHLIDRGFSEEEIDQHLGGLGSTTGKSQAVLSDYGTLGKSKNRYGQTQYQAPSNSSSGSSQVAIGAVIMLVGCAITFFSYQSAANSPTGGTYYITYGPIIFGGWLVLKGLMNGD